MFQSYDCPTIEFYNPNNTKEPLNDEEDNKDGENKPKANSVPTEEKSTTTELQDKVEEGI